MKIDLKDKTAVITGSTAGIGFATATGLAQAGATVIVNGRREKTVEAAVNRLKKEVPEAKVRGVAADLGSADGCAGFVSAQPSADILVNNLGIFELKDFFDLPDEKWEQTLEVNFMSGVRLSRAYLPEMMDRGWGRVIFVSSESALNIPAEMIHYGVTKTAYLALSRGLAKRTAGTGVTVNAVMPGPTLSEGLKRLLEAQQQDSGDPIEDVAADFVKENRPSSLLRRAASVEEVANMIVYLASPLSSATTGAALRVDGGVVETIT